MRRIARAAASSLAVLALVASASSAAMANPPAAEAGAAFTAPVDLALWNTGPEARYRIPALTTAPNGDLLAFFDARPKMDDLASPISLVMRRSTDGGATWQPLQTIRATDGVAGHGDPSVVVDRTTGRIFVFYASSVNAGYGASRMGNDPNDPNILQTDASFSDDNGQTWQHRRLTDQIKDPAWGGIFASSGEGIQLTQGPHAGRLIQQYVVRSAGQNWAMSAFSDDHGQTWQRGALTGPGMDENKTVELSDGRVLLDVRAAGARRVAVSSDGGQSYGPLSTDPQQVDPGSNGSVTRVYPDAAPDDPRAKMVLLVNSEDPGIRRNTTAKLSCDNGATWPGRVVLDAGSSAYATATPLGAGKMGILYERDGYSKISYTTLDTTAMGAQCAPLSVEATPSLVAGTTTPVSVTVTNQEGRALPPGTVTITGPDGWTASTTTVGALPPGRTATVTVPVRTPAGVSGPRDLRATYTTLRGASTLRVPVTVVRPADAADSAALRLEPYIDAVYPAGPAGLVGDLAVPWVRVTNTGNTTLTGIRVTSSTGESGCTVSSLAPGASAVCRDRAQMGRTLSAADIASGSWSPVYTATASGAGGTATATAALEPLDLVVP